MTSWLNIWMESKGPELNSQFGHSFLASSISFGIFKDFVKIHFLQYLICNNVNVFPLTEEKLK